MDIHGGSLDLLESFHFKAAKIVQGLSDQAVNVGSLITVGWKPIDLHIDHLRLMFLWRLLLLLMTNVYKTVMI